MRDNPNAPRALLEFSQISLDDAEEGVHKLFSKYRLTIPITPEVMNVGEQELRRLPYIRFSRWLRYLMDEELTEHICGVQEDERPALLAEFWRRYRAVHPEHALFQMRDIDLSACVPVFSHIDEGRTYKKQGLLILSVHGALGKGTRNYKRRVGTKKFHIKHNPMGMNYLGNTWGTQFMFCSLLRTAYAKSSRVLDDVLKVFAADMSSLIYDGVLRTTSQHCRCWFVFMVLNFHLCTHAGFACFLGFAWGHLR